MAERGGAQTRTAAGTLQITDVHTTSRRAANVLHRTAAGKAALACGCVEGHLVQSAQMRSLSPLTGAFSSYCQLLHMVVA